MKKVSSKILASGLILAVFLATVLCCNFSVAAQSNGSHCLVKKPETSTSTCHYCKTGTKSKSESSCCLKQLQADQPTQISLNFQQVDTSHTPLDVLPQTNPFLKTKFNLAYLDGPPGPISNTPFYILSHSFRI